MHGHSIACWSRFGYVVALVLPLFAFAESNPRAELGVQKQLRKEFNLALSQRLESSPEPRMQLAVAILSADPAAWNATADERSAPERRGSDAQARFLAVRQGSRDPLVLRFAAGSCRFDAVVCDADGAIAQLLRDEPRNVENLFLALARADDRDDASEVARLVGMLAQADHADGGYREAFRWWTDIYRLRADDPRLRAAAGYSAEQARSVTPALAIGTLALGHALAAPVLGRGVLQRECHVDSTTAAAASRLAECRQIGQLLREVGAIQIDRRAGYLISWRVAPDDAERSALEADWRRHEWTMSGVPQRAYDNDIDGVAGALFSEVFLASLYDGPSETAAMAAGRRAANLPLDPPADYQPTRTLAEIVALRQQAAVAHIHPPRTAESAQRALR
jgi:hypothetical protein